jgi:Holliday junction resolvase RusA-like endonuclease
MKPLQFEVVGLPAPQGSKSAIVRGGRAVMVEGKTDGQRAKHTSWRDSVATAARHVAEHDDVTAPLSGPLGIDVLFRMPRPASRPKSHHGWHTVAPDKDKLLRATFDALQAGGLVANDSMFASVHCAAFEIAGWSGAVITLWRLEPSEAYEGCQP